MPWAFSWTLREPSVMLLFPLCSQPWIGLRFHQYASAGFSGCWNLYFSQVYAQGFANDVAAIACGIDPGIVCSAIQELLNYTWNWCRRVSMGIHPEKIQLVQFTRMKNPKLNPIKLEGRVIGVVSQVKYLGITLDSKLSWSSHCKRKAYHGSTMMAQWRRALGLKWGFTPQVTMWLYTAAIRTAISYAGAV